MKTAAAKVMSASASAPPIWNRIRKTSAFWRKLSLNAEKNWVQNSGAKRRVNSKDEDMNGALRSFDRARCGPGNGRSKRRYFRRKNNRSFRHASPARKPESITSTDTYQKEAGLNTGLSGRPNPGVARRTRRHRLRHRPPCGGDAGVLIVIAWAGCSIVSSFGQLPRH